MPLLYLVRHAQASFHSEQYDRLSTLGQQQSRMLGNFFRDSGLEFDLAFSGSLDRQKQTAAIALARTVGISADDLQVLPGLNEHDTEGIFRNAVPLLIEGNPQLQADLQRIGTDAGSFARALKTVMEYWVKEDPPLPGVESWTEFKARTKEAITAIQNLSEGHSRILAITSGGPIAFFLSQALGLEPEKTLSLAGRIRNTSISVFKIGTDLLEMISFNSLAHLEVHGDRELLTFV